MELKVYSINGNETGRVVKLNDSVFSITPNDHAIYLDVKQYLADNRQGTHKSKERSENAHSTRKLKRQKGTGGARSGDLKSPVFVGGGTIFGPKPRDYRFKLNVKVKRLARRSALSYKVTSNSMLIVENFDFDQPKTKKMVEILNNLNLNNQNTLFILDNQNNFVFLSSRNLSGVDVVNVSELNTYDLVKANKIVVSEGAIVAITKVLATE